MPQNPLHLGNTTKTTYCCSSTYSSKGRDCPVAQESFSILVEAEDERSAGEGARSLLDGLRDVPGILKADRRKEDQSTMDLGAILTIVAGIVKSMMATQQAR